MLLQGKLTYSSLIAMLIVSLLNVFGVEVGQEEAGKAVEAGLVVVLFVTGVYGRWRVGK